MTTMAAVTLAQACRPDVVGAWWPIFPLLWLVVIVGFFTFFAFRFRRGWGGPRGRSAESVLAERYARGEVSDEEYRERLGVLREHHS